MRPLKIVMSAFGPYADEVTIDMESLGDRGLYLITGDTGAGKTTIFDAIAFALYGVTSGKNREKTMVRSNYASSDTPTFVELDFSYRDEVYKVTRNPEYERKSKRGGGMTREKSNASLVLPDGRLVSGENNVTGEIINILGVSVEQFSQIVMISQGEFQKLLFAPTKDKISIFRGIFKTEKYEDFQRLLKEKLALEKKNYEVISLAIDQYFESTEIDGEFDYKSLGVENSIALIEAAIDRDCSAFQKNEAFLQKAQNKISELSVLISKGEKIADEKEKCSFAKNKLEAKIQEGKEKKIIHEKAYLNLARADEIKLTVSKIEDTLPKYDKLDSLKSGYEITKKQYVILKDELDNSKVDASEKLTTIENLEKFVKENGQAELKLNEAKNSYRELEKSLNEKNTWISQYKAGLVKDEEYSRSKEEYIKLKNEAKEKREQYEILNESFLDGQAGIMAAKLGDSDPCPVCGSTVHPKLAVFSSKVPTEGELKKAKKLLDEKEKYRDDASKEANTLKGLIDEKNKNLEEVFKKLTGKNEIDILLMKELIKREISLLETAEKEINEFTKSLKQLLVSREKLEKLKIDAKKLNDRIAQLSDDLPKALSEMEVSKKTWEDEKEKLHFENKIEANKEIEKLNLEKDKLIETEKIAKNNLDNVNKDINIINGTIKTLEDSLRNTEYIDVATISSQRASIEEMCKIQSTERDISLNRYNLNMKALQSIKGKCMELESAEKNYAVIKNLSDTANGDLKGKAKIHFETFIQMNYFDQIIIKANIRLTRMSNGQYELKRANSGKLNTQSGLDLIVIDHYNGSERDVKTLSGGESFKASLSLALGLADIIEANVGGIKLDTMFIDEGFGSLDEESLRQAIDTLGDLAGNNRLIGIISHVKELKESVDKQIVITKNKAKGSQVKVIN